MLYIQEEEEHCRYIESKLDRKPIAFPKDQWIIIKRKVNCRDNPFLFNYLANSPEQNVGWMNECTGLSWAVLYVNPISSSIHTRGWEGDQFYLPRKYYFFIHRTMWNGKMDTIVGSYSSSSCIYFFYYTPSDVDAAYNGLLCNSIHSDRRFYISDSLFICPCY